MKSGHCSSKALLPFILNLCNHIHKNTNRQNQITLDKNFINVCATGISFSKQKQIVALIGEDVILRGLLVLSQTCNA
jgi:hypothetical protein